MSGAGLTSINIVIREVVTHCVSSCVFTCSIQPVPPSLVLLDLWCLLLKGMIVFFCDYLLFSNYNLENIYLSAFLLLVLVKDAADLPTMDPLQEPVVVNILFTSRQRRQMVLFHRRKQGALFDWLTRHIACLPDCSFYDSVDAISPESCFRFIYDDTLTMSKHSAVGAGPYSLLSQCSQYGVVFQDVVACDYYFVGNERVKDILHCCITSETFPPMISQMLDYQWDKEGRAGMHVTHLLNWKHFSHWFVHHGDYFNVSKEDREYSAVACNVFINSFLWFSEPQTSLHSAILALTVIDFFFTRP